jgi:hypothetical protein
MRHLTEEQFLEAFDKGEEIDEETLLHHATIFGETISEGENRRWSRSVVSVVKIGERYFQISYEEGLTEKQGDSCDEQPIEVVRHEYDKVIPEQIIPEHTIHVIEWKKKGI